MREVRVISLPLPRGMTLRDQPDYAALRAEGWELIDAMLSPRLTDPRIVVVRVARNLQSERKARDAPTAAGS